MAVYPTKEQVNRKTKELQRAMRQYILGLSPAYAVQNEFQCLFTDLFLETSKEMGDEKAVNGHFPTLIKDWSVSK